MTAPAPVPAGSPGREEAKVASPNGASPVASTSKKADRTSPKAVPKKASAVNPAPGSPSKGPAAISKDETSKTAIPPKLRAAERVHGIIREIADQLHLSQVIENRCKLLFKTIQDGNHCPSRSHKYIGSACVYISCMLEGQPHCYFEVVGNFTDTNRVALCASTIAKALDIQLTEIKAAHLTGRFATRLGLTEKIGRLATHIAQKSKELGIFKSQWQTSIAGAALYLACEVSTIQTDTKIIGELVGVGHTTILSSYKKLLPKKKELLPQDD